MPAPELPSVNDVSSITETASNVTGLIVTVIITPIVTLVAWLFRLDKRITVLEEKSTLMMSWLERVEGKLDQVLTRER
jgi:hypothetical protein